MCYKKIQGIPRIICEAYGVLRLSPKLQTPRYFKDYRFLVLNSRSITSISILISAITKKRLRYFQGHPTEFNNFLFSKIKFSFWFRRVPKITKFGTIIVPTETSSHTSLASIYSYIVTQRQTRAKVLNLYNFNCLLLFHCQFLMQTAIKCVPHM